MERKRKEKGNNKKKKKGKKEAHYKELKFKSLFRPGQKKEKTFKKMREVRNDELSACTGRGDNTGCDSHFMDDMCSIFFSWLDTDGLSG